MEILNNNDSGDDAAKDFKTVFNLLEPHCASFEVHTDLATLLARLAPHCASFEVHIQTTKQKEGKLTLDFQIVFRGLGTNSTKKYERVDWSQVAQTLIEFAQDQVKNVAALPNVWAMLKIIDFPTNTIVEYVAMRPKVCALRRFLDFLRSKS